MRQIGSLPNKQSASRFQDFLLTQGIQSSVEESGAEWTVWIFDEDTVEQAREEFAAFINEPTAERFRQASEAAAEIREESVKKAIAARRNVVNVRDGWNKPVTSRCPVTMGLMLLSILVAVLTRLGDQPDPLIYKLSIKTYSIRGQFFVWEKDGLSEIRRGEVWRLVTPIIIHFGLLHILFNMSMLYQFGLIIESRLQSFRFLLFVLLIAVLSNLGQYWETGPTFGGMSGVVYGLFGYLWMKSKYDPGSGISIPPSTVVILIGWFFLCMTGAIGSIANSAHGVGLVVGIVVGYARPMWRRMTRG